MKKVLFTLIVFIISAAIAYSQAPQAFKYQAVIRDTSGIYQPNKQISMRISILINDIYGEEVYQEIHNVTTDKLGLVNLNIGQGLAGINNFSEIPWGEGTFFIKVEMDMSGNSNYHLLGISQLLSVPYALFAESSGDNLWNECDDGIFYKSGKVGIGNTNPSAMLDVEHDAHVFASIT